MTSRFTVMLSLAAALAPAAAPAALPHRGSGDPLGDYVRARAADDLGALDVAAAGFAAALADNPGDTGLALRTLRQAVAAGDMALAIRTARGLDARGALPPDGTLLLLADAVATRDWRRAGTLADRIEREKLFGFLAPVLRAWIAAGRHHPDPQALVDAAQASPLAATYAAEQRVLLLLAYARPDEGVAALAALKLPEGARGARLRIAAAATVQRRGRRDLVPALLAADDPASVRARALLAAGRRLPGAIDTPAAGVAELFARVAADIDRQQAGILSIEFARIATLLAPDVSEGWLVAASLLVGRGDMAAALAALAHVAADDPFVGAARDLRLTVLTRTGRAADALVEAQASAAAPDAGAGDYARLGDLLAAADRNAEAATAYGRAVALSGGGAEATWPLLLQQASAQVQAGDWPGGRASATRALSLAPDQPAVLNFLGYSALEHGGDVAAASAMIARASLLAPDDPSITDSLGWSWYVRGDLAKAIPLLEQAARGAPAEPDINEHLGDAYWRAGRRIEARYAWRAALVGATARDVPRLTAKIESGPAAGS